MKRILSPTFVCILAAFLGSAAGAWNYYRGVSILLLEARARMIKAASARAGERAKGWDFWTIEIDNLASELKGERETLRKQQESLEVRSERLAAERADLQQLRSDLDQMRNEITKRITDIHNSEVKNLKVLAATYSNISPAACVSIFRTMDEGTAAKILFMMKPDAVGQVFEAMAAAGPDDSARAAVLSERIRWLQTQPAPAQ